MDIWREILERPGAGARRLVAEYGDRLYDVAFRLCLNSDEAQDLVDKTFVRAIERIGTFEERAPFYSWLYMILVNFWRMELRRRQTDRLVFTDDLPEHPDTSPDPAEELVAKADAAAVRAAVADLPTPLRAVTVFGYFEDMSVPEIARIMSIPEGTVKFRLHQARKRMRRILAQTVVAFGASYQVKGTKKDELRRSTGARGRRAGQDA